MRVLVMNHFVATPLDLYSQLNSNLPILAIIAVHAAFLVKLISILIC